jgi:hypothetical protein
MPDAVCAKRGASAARAAASLKRAEAAEKRMRERAETAAEAVIALERELKATRAS